MTLQILCTRPNASTRISGVAFHSTDNGMLSEPVSAEVAAQFEGIPGYSARETQAAREPDTFKAKPRRKADGE